MALSHSKVILFNYLLPYSNMSDDSGKKDVVVYFVFNSSNNYVFAFATQTHCRNLQKRAPNLSIAHVLIISSYHIDWNLKWFAYCGKREKSNHGNNILLILIHVLTFKPIEHEQICFFCFCSFERYEGKCSLSQFALQWRMERETICGEYNSDVSTGWIKVHRKR